MSREITTHKVEGADYSQSVTVTAKDEKGQGNANHIYEVTTLETAVSDPYNKSLAKINFQNGPVKESGINGISNESLLAIVIDRMQGFQSGDYRTREGALALTKLEKAMLWLHSRTRDRLERRVEGTHTK